MEVEEEEEIFVEEGNCRVHIDIPLALPICILLLMPLSDSLTSPTHLYSLELDLLFHQKPVQLTTRAHSLGSAAAESRRSSLPAL